MMQNFMVAAAIGGVPTKPDLSDFDSVDLTSLILQSGSDRPVIGIRFNTNGRIQKAEYDTASSASYTDIGWWTSNDVAPVDSSDWEVQLAVNSEDTGQAGTWSGTTGSYLALSSTRTWAYTKDSTTVGSSASSITITLRQVSATSNSDQSTRTVTVTISV